MKIKSLKSKVLGFCLKCETKLRKDKFVKNQNSYKSFYTVTFPRP